jgi:hypothetical protein
VIGFIVQELRVTRLIDDDPWLRSLGGGITVEKELDDSRDRFRASRPSDASGFGLWAGAE